MPVVWEVVFERQLEVESGGVSFLLCQMAHLLLAVTRRNIELHVNMRTRPLVTVFFLQFLLFPVWDDVYMCVRILSELCVI